MFPVSTVCLTFVAENNIKNIFRECNMVRNTNFDPFLTLSGIVIPRFQNIYETNLLNKERKVLEVSNPNSLLSILVRTPFTLEIKHNDKIFSFGPTGTNKEILYSVISTEELENFLDILFYLRNSPEKLIAVVFGNIIIFLFAALVFLAKVKPKKQRYAIHSRGNKTHIVKV